MTNFYRRNVPNRQVNQPQQPPTIPVNNRFGPLAAETPTNSRKKKATSPAEGGNDRPAKNAKTHIGGPSNGESDTDSERSSILIDVEANLPDSQASTQEPTHTDADEIYTAERIVFRSYDQADDAILPRDLAAELPMSRGLVGDTQSSRDREDDYSTAPTDCTAGLPMSREIVGDIRLSRDREDDNSTAATDDA